MRNEMRAKSGLMGAISMKLLALLLGAASMAAQEQPDKDKMKLQLTAALDGNHSLSCVLTVTNASAEAWTLEIAPDQPFTVSVIDQTGKDWNAEANQPVKRGKSRVRESRQPMQKLALAAGEAKTLTLAAALRDEHGAAVRLPAGKYTIEAKLVSVKYVKGQYQTTLFRSNTFLLNVL